MEQTHNVKASTLCPCGCGCTLPIESARPETLGAGYCDCGCGCQETLVAGRRRRWSCGCDQLVTIPLGTKLKRREDMNRKFAGALITLATVAAGLGYSTAAWAACCGLCG